jgi:hypothetical protein
MPNQLSPSYNCPMVLANQQVSFKTAHSWNKGKGHLGTGNGGQNYLNLPYTGPCNGNGDTKGKGLNK